MEKIMLDDISGYENVKKELKKIVYILNNLESCKKEGILLPRGILLYGDIGVGKTTFAKAIANESNANLFVFENKDNETVKNIKKIFDDAKKNRPSIILLDELDSIASKPPYGETSDEQKRIIQTLLTEIDGINSENDVLVVATACTKMNIPDALLRSGRIDKHFWIVRPSLKDRIKILDYYLSKNKLFASISREKLAEKLKSFTGADIKKITNEVLIDFKANGDKITIDSFEKIIPTILYKDMIVNNVEKDINIVALHEIGHFICNYVLFNEVAPISIEKCGFVTGFVYKRSKEGYYHKLEYLHELTVVLGGLACEVVAIGTTFDAGSHDLVKAVKIIDQMMSCGMYGFKYIDLNPDLYRKQDSEELLRDKEKLKIRILEQIFEGAKKIISNNMIMKKKLFPYLVKEKRLSEERIKEILDIE